MGRGDHDMIGIGGRMHRLDGSGAVPTAVRLRTAAAFLRAVRLHAEAAALVDEQQKLEAVVLDVAGGRVGDHHRHLREATGLLSLESVLGNAAVELSAPGGGLWCGGPARPWPDSAWPLDAATAS
jgi:hypothetical protein